MDEFDSFLVTSKNFVFVEKSAHDENSFLVKARERRIALKEISGMKLVDNPYITFIDVDDFSKTLKYVAENPQERILKGKQGRMDILNHWKWDFAVDMVLEKIRAML